MARGAKRNTPESGRKPDRVPAGSDRAIPLLRGTTAQVLLILIAGLLVYSNTFTVPFLLDDTLSILHDPVIKDLRNFLHPYHSVYNNRFIGQLSFALNYQVHGLDVAGYHVFNLAVHLLNALLVYWLLVLTFRIGPPSPAPAEAGMGTLPASGWVPLFTALLFAVHPVQTQAVTYVAQRIVPLATLFFLISLVMYSKARAAASSRRATYTAYAAAFVSALLAMRTKEIAATLPVVVVLYEFLFFRGDLRKRLLFLVLLLLMMLSIPLSLVAVGYSHGAGGIIETLDKMTQIAGSPDIPRGDYLLTQFRVIVTYLRLLFFPLGQNVDYDYPVYRTFFTPPVFLSVLLLAGILCGGMYLLYRSARAAGADRFRYRLIAFGIFWFFVTLSVESSIIPIADVIFEHRLYLPSVGFFLALVSAAASLAVTPASRGRGRAKLLVPVMIAAVIGLSLAAYARNTVWRDEVTLWEDTVRKSPQKARPRFSLAGAYLDQGRPQEAIAQYQAGLTMGPDIVQPHYNMGVAYQRLGRLEDAASEYRAAIRLEPKQPEIHQNLGAVYLAMGRREEAVEAYRRVLALRPNRSEAHYDLAVVYGELGRPDDAIAEYRTAIGLRPDYPEAHNNLGQLYLAMGRLDDAAGAYQRAIGVKPDYADAHNNLGVVYQKMGRLDEAIGELQRAIQIDPSHAKARSNLGIVTQKKGLGGDNAASGRGRR